MALNPIPVGDAIATYLFNQTVVVPGTQMTLAQSKIIWENIMTIIYDDLEANLGVQPGTFVVAGVQPGSSTIPVTGIGGPAQ